MPYCRTIGARRPIVVRDYGEQAFTFSDNMIAVTIPFARKNVPVNDTEQKILSILLDDPTLNYEEIATIWGKTRKTIMRNIQTLKEKGLMEREGSDKTGSWVVKK